MRSDTPTAIGVGVDPLLAPLAWNGGPTQTHALLPGSPAINNGSNPAGLLTDQRGPGYKRGAVTGARASPDTGAGTTAKARTVAKARRTNPIN